jgi:hypothetical protein
MWWEVTVWLLLLYGLMAITTGFNAQYFWGYRSMLPRNSAARRRRLAALVLALLHGALFLENAYFGAAYVFSGGLLVVSLPPALWLPLRAFLMAASGAVTLLVLRSTAPTKGGR